LKHSFVNYFSTLITRNMQNQFRWGGWGGNQSQNTP